MVVMRLNNNLIEKGEKIYYKIKPELLRNHSWGKYVSIEVDSEKYFIGRTMIEALLNAEKAFPHKQFFIANIRQLYGTI